jgi:hypothetical protein
VAELTLEPYAARLLWSSPLPRDGAAWATLIAEFAETLAERCHEAGPCVVGHIKGFAPLEGGFLRVNSTGPSAPVDVDARSSAGCAELTFSLNVLVYGLAAGTLADLTAMTATETASAHGGAVILLPEG